MKRMMPRIDMTASGLAARSRGARTGSILGIVISIALCPPVSASPGGLDPAFDGDGRVTTDLGSRDENVAAVAVQSDGKIVVIGVSPRRIGDDYVLARYTSAGILDTTFDGDGIRVFGGMDPVDVAIQADGKLVVAGSALARFNADGTFDSSFGVGGIADGGAFGESFFGGTSGLALQPDGKIVVAGTSYRDNEHGSGLIARFNSDGTADLSFGDDGSRFVFGPSAHGASIQPDGKIVVAGVVGGEPESTRSRFAVARLRRDGSFDSSFSGDGLKRTNFGGDGRALDVAVEPDGKVLASGSAGGDFAMARYTRRGKLDATFSGDGKTRTDFRGGYDSANALILQANGRIVLAGSAAPPRHSRNANFGLARYRASGRLDLTFSGDGKQRTRFGTGHRDYGHDATLQADRRIVVAGQVTAGIGGYDFGLARYRSR